MKVASFSFWLPKHDALLFGLAVATMAPAVCGCAPRSAARQMANRQAPGTGQVMPAASASHTSAAEKDALLNRLKAAEHVAKMNSTSWSDTNATLDTYYSIKARQLRQIIERIESGGPVSQEAIAHAMDNSQIRSLGGY
jgi:hypothetical protein